MAPRETKNYVYAKFWGDKQRALVCSGIGPLQLAIHVVQNRQAGEQKSP